MKTTFRLVGGTDVDPASAKSPPPKRKRDRPNGIMQAIDPSLVTGPPAEFSITAANGILRKERYEVWRMAEAAVNYWRARMKFHNALACAQQNEIPEGRLHLAIDEKEYMPMVDKWRAAIARQFLTPAPTAAAINWKKDALARGHHEYTGVKPERIERAIADDLAFLAAHPVCQSNRKIASKQ
jgi:hypothetical protein